MYFLLCMCAPSWVYVYHTCAGACGGLRAWDAVDLELQAVGYCLIWLLGTKPESFVRALSAFEP